jgi:membrane-anchored protein YejM (alkaline phosphatase superfamily)
MFFSIPSYYWDVFESNRQSPVFIDEMLRQGYQCQVYPSASFRNPPFNRVLFQHVKGLNVQTKGKTVYDRDVQLTKNFLADLPQRAASGKPFFSMLFYDLAHSYEMPQDRNTRFQPAWAFADYTKLNNDIDPTPYYNLYRNCCYQIDMMVHQVLTAIEQAGLANITIVLITGDHAQEFNENKKNFWGHNGNFSRWQVCVPLLMCP